MNNDPRWFFNPSPSTQMSIDDIIKTKKFYQDLENEFKVNSKKDEKKEDKKPSVFKYWVALGLIFPVVFMGYGLMFIWVALKIIEMAHAIQIR